ncbi:DNA primase [Puniceicoccaceae bacterium K14]|nr:DNA primase [Puniceicoccaceae bacterium K14]
MPAIKPSSIRDLKDRINIHDVVARVVSLKRSGSSFKGLSPFTNEKTPSFYVSPDKGLYKCFSTGQAGDVIKFVMETERLNFYEAIQELSKRHSIELEYEEGGMPQEDRTLRQELFELHDFATEFYRNQFLASNDEGSWIRDYWTENRKFSMDVGEDFKIGYAPVNGIDLGRAVAKKGFSRECLEQSGLFYTRRGTRPEQMGYRFRGRLMIPIRDYQGRVVAFTARQLEVTPQDDPSREAKYVNSPETPIFNKGSLLFNLDRARMKVGPDIPFVMVEGQLDAIRCWSEGLLGAVAPQGTGITERQLRLLKRYEPRLICLLDGDKAGQKAALRMLPLAFAQEVETTFIPLKEGEDPDDLFREHGIEAFNTLQEQQFDSITFACLSIAPDPNALSPQAKAKAAREVFAIIKTAESSAEQIEFVKQTAEYLNFDSHAAVADYKRYLKSGDKAPQQPKLEQKTEPKPTSTVHSVERDLLITLLHYDEFGAEAAQIIDPEWLETRTLEGELLNHVLNEFLHDMWDGAENLNESLDRDELSQLTANLLFEETNFEFPDKIINEAIKSLARKHADQKIKQINLEIARKGSNFDDETKSLLQQSSALQKIKANPPQLGKSSD